MKNKVRLSVFSLVLIAGIFLAACGPLPAGAEIQVSKNGDSAQVEFTGKVDSIAADQWVIAGQTLDITPQTVFDAAIVAGDMVKVHATITLDGKVAADSIELYKIEAISSPDPSSMLEASSTPEAGLSSDANHAKFVGVVETIAPDAWNISGLTFAITLQTEIKSGIVVGDTVKVEALVNTDGTFTATEIKLDDDSGSGTPTPGLASGELEMTGTVESIAADQWIISGLTFIINPMTEIKDVIIVGEVVKVEAKFGSDGVFTASEIHLAEEMSQSSEDSSTPDDDLEDLEMEFTGVVEAIGPDSWTIGGKTFTIDPKTEIKDEIIVGDMVKVEANGNLEGTLIAHEIEKEESFSSSSSSSGSDSSGSAIIPAIQPPSDDESHDD